MSRSEFIPLQDISLFQGQAPEGDRSHSLPSSESEVTLQASMDDQQDRSLFQGQENPEETRTQSLRSSVSEITLFVREGPPIQVSESQHIEATQTSSDFMHKFRLAFTPFSAIAAMGIITYSFADHENFSTLLGIGLGFAATSFASCVAEANYFTQNNNLSSQSPLAANLHGSILV